MRQLVVSALLAALVFGPANVVAAQQAGNGASPGPAAGAENGDVEVLSGDHALDPGALPVDVEKIQQRLSRPPAIRPESTRVVFRVEVFGRNPTIDEILGPDWRKGPTPAGPMTHGEFLSMVTPRDVQGYAMYDNKQAATVAATSFAIQWALRQALTKLKDAVTERQKAAAKREVDEALAALRRARAEAGLPPK